MSSGEEGLGEAGKEGQKKRNANKGREREKTEGEVNVFGWNGVLEIRGSSSE